MPKLKYKLKQKETPIFFRETGKFMEIPMVEQENDAIYSIEQWIKENCHKPAKIVSIPDYDYMGTDTILIDFKSKEDMLLFKLKYE